MKLSVVIPYYRDGATIAGQLEALARQEWSEAWEVVISDNEGSDELATISRAFEDRLCLRVVDSSDRRSAGHARNMGVEAARGESFAFCDADDEVGSGWLPAIGAALSQNDFVACRSDIKKLNPEWVQKVFADDPQQWGLERLKCPPYMPFAGGSSLGIKRSVHERVGGFDESWPVFQDIDYCIRVQLSGTQLRFVPEALIHYRYRADLGHLLRRAHSWGKHYVRLYKRYRTPHTETPGPWKWEIGQLYHLFRTRSQARSPSVSERAAWLFRLCWNIGLLHGCARYVVAPPVPALGTANRAETDDA